MRLVPRFTGKYGKDAMKALVEKSDNLFATTMTEYKQIAQKECERGGSDPFCLEVYFFHGVLLDLGVHISSSKKNFVGLRCLSFPL